MTGELWKFESIDLLLAAQTVGDALGSVQWVIAVWIFCVGACFGSLLNVIVYRWPAGLSIVVPRSGCPKCGHRIRFYDNIPILSWFVLRGRCRDCRAPISGRYPAVEALVACVFLALLLVGVFPRGASLARGAEGSGTLVWLNFVAQLVLLYFLIAAALIQADGQRVPLRVYLPVLVVGLLLPIATGWLDSKSDWLSELGSAFLGLVAGGLLACLTMPAVGRDWWRGEAHFALLALCGLVLGAPAAMLVACIVVILSLCIAIERRLRRNVMNFPAAGFTTIGVLIVLIYWSAIEKRVEWVSVGQTVEIALLFAPILLCVSLVARWLDK